MSSEQLCCSDVVLFVGVNPRLEATLLNTRIRKKYLRKEVVIGSIGAPIDTTYFIELFKK